MIANVAPTGLVPDRRYTVDLLARLNGIKSSGMPLHECFMYGSYSLWSMQQFYLFTQIEAFSKSKKYASYLAEVTPRYGALSLVFLGIFDALLILVSCISAVGAWFQKPKVLTFSSDFLNASPFPNPRLRNIHMYLTKHKVPYVELFHITTTAAFFRNIAKYRRLGIYREAVAVLGRLLSIGSARIMARKLLATLDLRGFCEEEQQFLRFLITKTVLRAEESRRSIPLFRKLFRFLRVTSFFSVDDFRYIPELMVACEEAGIPTHVFQHSNFGFLTGLFTLQPHMYAFPTAYYTWNGYWQKRVEEISPFFAAHKSRIRIGGRSYTPATPIVVSRSVVEGEKNPLIVLMPCEVTAARHQVQPYVDAMLQNGRIQVLLMLRGSIEQLNSETQIEKYVPNDQHANPNLVIMDSSRRDEALKQCDMVAGIYSGFLDETLETGLPVCILKSDFININRLDTDNLATLIDVEKGDVYNQLLGAYHTSDAVLRERRDRVNAGVVDINETLAKILQN